MQEGNKSLVMLKIVQFGRENFILSPVAYVTVDFKKLVGDLFHGIKRMHQEKTRLSEWPQR